MMSVVGENLFVDNLKLILSAHAYRHQSPGRQRNVEECVLTKNNVFMRMNDDGLE